MSSTSTPRDHSPRVGTPSSTSSIPSTTPPRGRAPTKAVVLGSDQMKQRLDGSREADPLLSPARSTASYSHSKALESPSPSTSPVVRTHELDGYEETHSSWRLLMTTITLGGLQIAWSVELASISPFLLSLGLSKSLLALVWIAGPLSGTLVQPYIGILSDNSRMRWGRRKPFMVLGAGATMASLLLLSWTREIVAAMLSLLSIAPDSRFATLASQAFAVLLVYLLDFAINVIQAATRAFIVDCTPTHQQEAANAWASRVTGVGNILGYLAGYVDLPQHLPWLGDSQFKVLCALACAGMASTLGLSCAAVRERDPALLEPPTAGAGGALAFVRSLARSMRALPRQIRMVCLVQVCAWVAWFPFLFYITTYVGQIYADPFFRADEHLSDEEINAIFERGTRVGTLALFGFAIVTFAASVVLPFMIAPTYHAPTKSEATPLTPRATTTTPSTTGGGARDYFGARPARWRLSLRRLSLRVPGLTLRRLWLLSHVALALCLWATLLVRGTLGASLLVGAVGVPWAVTNWAPFALIAAEISQRDAVRRGARPPPPTREGRALAAGQTDPAGDQAGVVLGIHNVAVAAPQVVATLGSSVVFALLQKPRGAPGDDSVAWVLRIGGVFALLAAVVTRGVGEGDGTGGDDSSEGAAGGAREGA